VAEGFRGVREKGVFSFVAGGGLPVELLLRSYGAMQSLWWRKYKAVSGQEIFRILSRVR
jgi:hypothetical protein